VFSPPLTEYCAKLLISVVSLISGCWQLASHEYLLQFCFTNYNKWLEASSRKLAAFSYLRLLKFLGIIHEYHVGPGDRIH
jgi:hypothetical protein